jgi:predicted transcriptional regulator
MKVKDIMNTDVITVKPSDTVGKALQIMKDKKINGTPVVNDRNILLGIVVKADIYRFLIQPGHYEDCPIEWVRIYLSINRLTLRTINREGKQLKY